jgi:dUTP pyrophosphatase
MTNRVAQFYKIPYDKFKRAWINTYGPCTDEHIKEIYDKIELPKRATSGSMGYDFIAPKDITLDSNQTEKVPTGIGIRFIESGWGLFCLPRSSYGFKYRLQLDNTVGVIDEDYCNADNGGHIFEQITNDSKTKKLLKIKQGERFCQGIIIPYGITVDDDCEAVRTGGLGSTGTK